MRRLLIIMLLTYLIGLPSTLWAAASQVQHVKTITGAGQNLATATYTVGANSLLVAVCTVFQGTFSATNPVFSDTLTNSWSAACNRGVDDSGSHVSRVYLGYALSPSGGSNTVTCNPPGSSDYISLVIIEYSGIVTSSPLDQAVASNDTTGGTTLTTATTGTTSQADEVLVAGMVYDGNIQRTITEQSPLVLVDESEVVVPTSQSIAAGERILSSAGTFSASWVLSGAINRAATCLATFKAAAAGGSTRRAAPIVFP